MSETIQKDTIKEAIKPPAMWQVVILNDDFTTMEFVIACLCCVFGKSAEEAARIMMEVHTKGKGLVGRYTRDIATTKQRDAMDFAQSEGHPLQIIAEPEA